MKERVDAKGKVYTVRMSKETLRARIRTMDQVIEGTVYLHAENRLKDELNEGGERFIAVTSVRVFTADGRKELYKSDFLTLNRDQIIWAIPVEEPREQEK